MKTIDIHCHMNHAQFAEDRHEVIREAQEKMHFLITAGAHKEWNRGGLTLARKYPGFVYTTAGIQPIDAMQLSEKEVDEELEFLNKNSKEPGLVGVGEIGLDYHWEKESSKRRLQEEVFRRLIRLASDIKKPVVVHSWEAEAEAVKVLRDEDAKVVVLHCFSGKQEVLEEALKEGFYISLSTQICFSEHHRKLAKDIPLDRLFIETDAPYLDPNRGRNVPWNSLLAAQKIAEAKEVSVEEVVRNVLMNANVVFGI